MPNDHDHFTEVTGAVPKSIATCWREYGDEPM
jgi:hypothetical protein